MEEERGGEKGLMQTILAVTRPVWCIVLATILFFSSEYVLKLLSQ